MFHILEMNRLVSAVHMAGMDTLITKISTIQRLQKKSTILLPLQAVEGHTNWVIAVAFSRDGQLVASASNDKTVRLKEFSVHSVLGWSSFHIVSGFKTKENARGVSFNLFSLKFLTTLCGRLRVQSKVEFASLHPQRD